MRAMRSDANENEIVRAFEKCGCSVERIRSLRGGCPDLLVGFRGRTLLVEVKVPKTGSLSETQRKWREGWKGSKPFVIKSVDDVVSFVSLIGATGTTKAKIGGGT